MKTALTVLQEMMVKMGQTPEYECISQSGPRHSAIFEYRCCALGHTETATARSKKEAKQEAARRTLLALAARGHAVPPPYAAATAASAAASAAAPPKPAAGVKSGCTTEVRGATGLPLVLASRNAVVLLKDLCEEYRMPAVEYELVGDTGPAHLRHFTVRASMGAHVRLATATTKKTARQLAAYDLYCYLHENMSRVIKDFDEETALVRAHERVMERLVPAEESPRRPDLGQRLAEYHLGLRQHCGEEKRAEALTVMSPYNDATETHAETILTATVKALDLTETWVDAETTSGTLVVVEITPTSPTLSFAGDNRQEAAAMALEYFRLAFSFAVDVK